MAEPTSDPGYFFSPTQLAGLVMSIGLIPFICKWLWDRLWKDRDAAKARAAELEEERELDAERERDAQLSAVAADVKLINAKLDERFDKVMEILTSQGTELAEVKVEQRYMKERQDRHERMLLQVPHMIVESRHKLRNELTSSALAARVGKKVVYADTDESPPSFDVDAEKKQG